MEKLEEITCSCCGAKDGLTNRDRGEIRTLMEEKNICYTCAFWENQMKRDKSRNFAIINGKHYVLEPHTDHWPQGCAGSKFKIRFNDGREEICDNLWVQGKIPEHFRGRMPDNAVFVKEKGFNWFI